MTKPFKHKPRNNRSSCFPPIPRNDLHGISSKHREPRHLDKYAEGIRRLYSTHGHWTVILVADERDRSEQWDILAEKFYASPPPEFRPSAPWDCIIKESAYGLIGALAEWWYGLRGGGAPYLPRPQPSSSRGLLRGAPRRSCSDGSHRPPGPRPEAGGARGRGGEQQVLRFEKQ